MTTQKFTIHTKLNNEDVILHPKTEVSQVEGFTQSVNGLIDTAIADIDDIPESSIKTAWDNIDPDTSVTTYAPLASPAFTGTPTAPTAEAATNTTQIATTAFVKNVISAESSVCDGKYVKISGDTIHGALEVKNYLKTPTINMSPELDSPINGISIHDQDTLDQITVQTANNETVSTPFSSLDIIGYDDGEDNATLYLSSAAANYNLKEANSISSAFPQQAVQYGSKLKLNSSIYKYNDASYAETADNYFELSASGVAINSSNNPYKLSSALKGDYLGNLTWTANGVTHNVAMDGHTHPYVPTYGGTMTATLKIDDDHGSIYYPGIKMTGNGQNFAICISDTSVTKGTAPSSTKYWGIDFYGKDVDNYNKRIGMIEASLSNANTSNTWIRAYNCTSNTNTASASAGPQVLKSGELSFIPGGNATHYLGTSAYRWKQLFASTTTISTSDERAKDNIELIPENVLDAWDTINWCEFNFKDALKEKGNNARIHTGLIAQQIRKAFEDHDLDASKYGFFCYDKWDAVEPTYDEEGNVYQEGIEAGDAYSLRYEEALALEAAWQRRENKKLRARIDELEERLAKLEDKE